MLSFTTNGNFIDFKYTEDQYPFYEHQLTKLHNTSKCITWGYSDDTTRISFTIDDETYDNIPISSIYFDGVVMSAQADFKTNIESMFPGLAGRSYLVYDFSAYHFSIVQPDLSIGTTYTIWNYQAGDDFSNVANVISGTINTNECVFIATGTTPTNYTNGTELASLGLVERTNEIGSVSFIYKGSGVWWLIGTLPLGMVECIVSNGNAFSNGTTLQWAAYTNEIDFTPYTQTGAAWGVADTWGQTFIQVRVYS